MEKDEQRSSISKPSKRSSNCGNKLLKLLPMAATAAVSFQNPPYSPGRSSDNINTTCSRTPTHHRSPSHVGKGFSGPLMIPKEARRRTKKDYGLAAEPVSPKVSCMGQIKLKKKAKENAQFDKSRSSRSSPTKKQGKAGEGRSDVRRDGEEPEMYRLSDRGAPGLGQMRRFASGRREALAGFDWLEAQVAPVDGGVQPGRTLTCGRGGA